MLDADASLINLRFALTYILPLSYRQTPDPVPAPQVYPQAASTDQFSFHQAVCRLGALLFRHFLKNNILINQMHNLRTSVMIRSN